MESKGALRDKFRQLLADWRRDRVGDFEEAQNELVRNLVEFLRHKKGLWCGYQALPDEPDLTEVFKKSSHLEWVFPLVDGQELSYWLPQNSMSFQKGSFGIQEPLKERSRAISLSEINGFLVPGRAFDQKGFRLGRGKSFYDRALKNFTGQKVGVCFSPQWSAKDLPADVWDIRMDAVMTEQKMYLCSASP